MRVFFVITALCIAVSCLAAPELSAQSTDWRPPSTEMPMMPHAAELRGDWLQPRSDWFRGVEAVSGVAPRAMRASGDRRGGSDRLQIARFGDGPVPVVVWSDRNGDDRADMIEIFRAGGMIIQVIDADYSGRANVMRVYDSSGALLREVRL